jgi:hypothetical protein
MKREPFFGPNAGPFLAFVAVLAIVSAAKVWVAPMVKGHDRMTGQPACAEGLPPPPAGFIVLCD